MFDSYRTTMRGGKVNDKLKHTSSPIIDFDWVVSVEENQNNRSLLEESRIKNNKQNE